jgi:O-antigen/teichoic acid export membrane protein
LNFKELIKLSKISGGYFITSVINNALPFILLPVLTHYLLPDDYANITLFSTYFAVLNAFSGAAIKAYIANIFFSKSNEFIAKNIGNSLVIIIGFSFGFTILLYFAHSLTPNMLGLDLLWLLLVPVASAGYLIFQLALSVMRNQMRVLKFSYHQIGNTILNTMISLLLVAVILIGWQGRVLGILVSFIISAGFSICYLKRQDLLNFTINVSYFKKIFKFVLTLAPNSLQSILVSKIGILFLQFFFTKEILGIYSVGFQVAYSVMILIITLDMSWSPYFFKQLSDKSNNKITTVRLLYAHIGIVLAGVIFVNVFAEFIIKLMTSKAYYSAVEFIPWLTFGFLFNAVVVFTKPALIKAQLEKDIGLVSAVNLIIMVILNYFLTNAYGYIGVAYAFFVTYLIMFLMVVVILAIKRKTINLPWFKAFIFFRNSNE